jgi:hypothetical protein
MRTTLKLILACGAISVATMSSALAANPMIQKFIGAKAETFDSQSAAVDAFKSRLIAKDVPGLSKLLGLNAEAAARSDDFSRRLDDLAKAAAQRLTIVDRDADHKELDLGDDVWPFPFPLEKTAQGWQFNTTEGLEEVIDRRIGENENEAIATCRLFLTAQALYASEDRDNDGVLEYAQKLVSTPGTHDGLYWPEEDGGVSPAGNFANPARVEAAAASNQGYFGYRFRILKTQGSNIAGGEYNFVINGNMIAGYAMIARPAVYGETGVMTFLVSHHGTIYQKDLGTETAALADKITSFNPNKTWSIVDDGN